MRVQFRSKLFQKQDRIWKICLYLEGKVLGLFRTQENNAFSGCESALFIASNCILDETMPLLLPPTKQLSVLKCLFWMRKCSFVSKTGKNVFFGRESDAKKHPFSWCILFLRCIQKCPFKNKSAFSWWESALLFRNKKKNVFCFGRERLRFAAHKWLLYEKVSFCFGNGRKMPFLDDKVPFSPLQKMPFFLDNSYFSWWESALLFRKWEKSAFFGREIPFLMLTNPFYFTRICLFVSETEEKWLFVTRKCLFAASKNAFWIEYRRKNAFFGRESALFPLSKMPFG